MITAWCAFFLICSAFGTGYFIGAVLGYRDGVINAAEVCGVAYRVVIKRITEEHQR